MSTKCSRNMDGNGGNGAWELFSLRLWLTWMSLSLFFCSYDFFRLAPTWWETHQQTAPSFSENPGRIFLDINFTTFFHTLFQFWAGKHSQTKIRKTFSLDLFLLGIHDHRWKPTIWVRRFLVHVFFSSRKSKLMFLEL